VLVFTADVPAIRNQPAKKWRNNKWLQRYAWFALVVVKKSGMPQIIQLLRTLRLLAILTERFYEAFLLNGGVSMCISQNIKHIEDSGQTPA